MSVKNVSIFNFYFQKKVLHNFATSSILVRYFLYYKPFRRNDLFKQQLVTFKDDFVRLSIGMSVRQLVSLFSQSVCLSIHPPIHPSIHSSIRPSVGPSIHLSVPPSVLQPLCPSIGLQVKPFVCQSVCQSSKYSLTVLKERFFESNNMTCQYI